MPKEIAVTVYQYAELPTEAAKARAREWYREFVFSDSSDWDSVYEDAQTIAEMIGIELSRRTYETFSGKQGTEPCIFFSGFSSQGDGASYEGRYTYKADALAAVKDHAPEDQKLHKIAATIQDAQEGVGGNVSFDITARGNYSHSYSMRFEPLYDGPEDGPEDGEPAALNEAEKTIQEALRQFADWIYAQLEAEYDYQSSDEAVVEAIEGNEYEFDKSGERFVVR